MINTNDIKDFFPAFNKSLLEALSGNYLLQKHNYILDVLQFETVHNSVFIGVGYGFLNPIIYGGAGTSSSYKVGDFVAVFQLSGTGYDYSGVYRVLSVPTNFSLVIDTDYITPVTNAEIRVFKVFRSKLPASPNGTALFNANGFSTGTVTEDFDLDNNSIFNVPNSFARFKYLLSEEYYSNLQFTNITNNGGLAELNGVVNADQLEIGGTIEIVQNVGNLYNGVYEVTDINSNDVKINVGYSGDYIGTGEVILLPKLTRWYNNFGDLSTEKIIFNGALPFPTILDFNEDNYNMSNYNNASFLTTAPELNKIRLNQRSYTQFYQSDNTTVLQYAIEVTDSNGVLHTYIVNSTASPEEVLGLAVGTLDINNIPADDFEVIPARDLPVIRCEDLNYCVYLYGEPECSINGLQTTNFQHPYLDILNPNTWNTNNINSYAITVLDYELGGVPQTITPSGNTYNEATVTAQTSEEIYSNEIALQTSLNIQSADTFGSGLPSSHWIEINFNTDFYLKVRISLGALNIYNTGFIDVEYKFLTSNCKTSYRVTNGVVGIIKPVKPSKVEPKANNVLSGFIGLQSTPVTPDQISEKLCFELNYKPDTYKGCRLLFEDRLGSFIGFNFDLKRVRSLEVSNNGYEVKVDTIEDRSTIERGFKTIGSSYTEEWLLRTDYLTEAEVTYLEEAFTSPNVYVQTDEDLVLPVVVKPETKVIPTSVNSDLKLLEITIRVNRTNYTQRN